MKYICELCGMVYDETVGDGKRGIAPGTAFAELPDDYECPGCGSGKEAFSPAEHCTRSGVCRSDERSFWEEIKYSDDHGDSQR